LIIQIINLSPPAVFKAYSEKYNIFRDVYSRDLLGLELRNIPINLADDVRKVVFREREICYKKKTSLNVANLFIPGQLSNFKELSRRILSFGDEDLGYKISRIIKSYEEYESNHFSVADQKFHMNSAYVVGILNITPDSFSDAGSFLPKDVAVQKALSMISEGASIIDIGGESTRPGADPVSVDEELSRIIPVIEGVLEVNPKAIISVDTYKSQVAKHALLSGAKIINDISGLSFDNAMIDVVKEKNTPVILMHIKGTPKDMQKNPHYDDLISEVYDHLYERTQYARRAGLNNIIIDPGIGFGKTIKDNYTLLSRLSDFKSLGFPILTGVSRKSFIGKTLNLEVGERDIPSAIVDAIAIKNGAKFIRTHNVKYGSFVCKLLNNLI
jgi:dihydropteroate synthase